MIPKQQKNNQSDTHRRHSFSSHRSYVPAEVLTKAGLPHVSYSPPPPPCPRNNDFFFSLLSHLPAEVLTKKGASQRSHEPAQNPCNQPQIRREPKNSGARPHLQKPVVRLVPDRLGKTK